MNIKGIALSSALLIIGLNVGPFSRFSSRTSQNQTVAAFVDVSVVPMDRERVLDHQTVVVQDGHIAALGPANQIRIPSGAQRIDARGKYVIPGLADMHMHFWGDSASAERAAYMLVANGITTIRVPNAYAFDSGHVGTHTDAYGRNAFSAFLLRLRARAAAGDVVSPRISLSGPWGPKQYLDISSNLHTQDEPPPRLDSVAAYIAAYKAAGYDFVKIHNEDTVMAESVVVAARRVGIPVLGHVPIPPGPSPFHDTWPEWIVRMHYASIEHLTWYKFRQPSFDGTKITFIETKIDSTRVQTIAEEIQRAGIWSCPTIFADEVYGGVLEDRTRWPELRYVPPQLINIWETDSATTQLDSSFAPTLRFVRALQAVGAGLLSGTDASDAFHHYMPYAVPGFSLHRELAAFVRAGLTPYQALVTSTRNVADYLGNSAEAGTIAVGKRADLVLLDGNPLVDIRQTDDIAGVMLGRRWLSYEVLQRRLDADRPAWVSTVFKSD